MVAAEDKEAAETVDGVEDALNLTSIEVAEGNMGGNDNVGATGAVKWAAIEEVAEATAVVCAAAGAALPMPKILTEDLGILATRDTVGAGTRFLSVGAADSVTAGAATADDDATG